MAEPVFFSFHYKHDVHRAWRVRNSWVTKYGEDAAFDDQGLREAVKRDDERAIRNAINRGIRNTTVTVVLIGRHTASRDWVLYEIGRTFERGNALLGITIHNLKDITTKKTTRAGANPFRFVNVEVDEGGWFSERIVTKSLWQAYGESIPIYDWVDDDGYNNMADWIDEAVDECPW